MFYPAMAEFQGVPVRACRFCLADHSLPTFRSRDMLIINRHQKARKAYCLQNNYHRREAGSIRVSLVFYIIFTRWHTNNYQEAHTEAEKAGFS